MRVAVVYDWLTTYGGAERVLEHILDCFPAADVFTLVDFLEEKDRHFLRGRPVTTSIIQKLPLARSRFRYYLPFFAYAVEQLDLTGYDLVLSSSWAVAKGVNTSAQQLHICYCHTPIRYVWDLKEQYLEETGFKTGPKSFVLRRALFNLRQWDVISSLPVDEFVANSRFVADRIMKCYRRPATVIYPPVDVLAFDHTQDKGDHYIALSRLVPYKKTHLIVEAFRRLPGHRLVVIGDGPEAKRVRAAAEGSKNIELCSHQPFDVVRQRLQTAKALVFAAEEDFGIVSVEAQAAGTPVIAFGRGGSVETVRALGEWDRPTGLFFDEQSPEEIAAAILRFEHNRPQFSAEACRAQALRFSIERFKSRFSDFVMERYDRWNRQAESHLADGDGDGDDADDEAAGSARDPGALPDLPDESRPRVRALR
jgi:glycosyltransferase involved in cell wall biosynthesis